MQLNNLNIAVLGAGRSGRAAARLAMKHGARVRVFDASASVGGWPEDIPLHAAAHGGRRAGLPCGPGGHLPRH